MANTEELKALKFGNNTIKQVYFGDQSICKILLGNSDGSCSEVFLDRTVEPWAKASAEGLKRALERHRAGIVNLYNDEGWKIGSKREVTLKPISKAGMKSLAGTTWVFKGRKPDAAKIIDTDSLPDYSDGKKKWRINFSYYKVSSGGTTKATKKKGKDPLKEWVGSYNALAKDSLRHSDSMCYIKEKDTSYETSLVFYNTKDSEGKITSSKWVVPSPKKNYKSLSYYKVNGSKVLSPYQEIKITDGEDVQNEELINWFKANATCLTTKFTDAEWSVAEEHPQQTVHLVLAHKASEYNGDIKGFSLATGSDEDDPEIPNQKPVFIVCQDECLNTSGKLLAKTKTEKKTVNGKTKSVTTEVGSNARSWGGTSRREWCNRGYFLSLPKDIQDILQPFKWEVGNEGGTEGTTEFTDTIALPLEKHVLNARVTSTIRESNTYDTWEYYKDKDKDGAHIKEKSDGTKINYWTASPSKGSTTSFAYIKPQKTSVILDKVSYPSGSAASNKTNGLSPFMII